MQALNILQQIIARVIKYIFYSLYCWQGTQNLTKVKAKIKANALPNRLYAIIDTRHINLMTGLTSFLMMLVTSFKQLSEFVDQISVSYEIDYENLKKLQ